jgi:hypothetical protein
MSLKESMSEKEPIGSRERKPTDVFTVQEGVVSKDGLSRDTEILVSDGRAGVPLCRDISLLAAGNGDDYDGIWDTDRSPGP